MEANFTGYIDLCVQSHAQGWACRGTVGSAVIVTVNGNRVGEAIPSLRRPDLIQHGLDELSGWTFTFPKPLTENDEVAVLFPDGTHLGCSPNRDHSARLRKILYGLRRETMIGLEMGALDRPILGKERWRVHYVDHASRADLISKYGPADRGGQLDPERIVETDIVWAGGSLADQLAPDAKFDFCIASHVIEHVPDALGWLEEISEVLNQGGLINLAIPDREQTFDRFRRTTAAAEMIDDYLQRVSRPTARQIFDHIAFVSPIPGRQLYNPAAAYEVAKAAQNNGQYVDVHCRVFTQQSFLKTFAVIADAGILKLKLKKFFPTAPRSNEFIVSLQKSEGLKSHEIAESYRPT